MGFYVLQSFVATLLRVYHEYINPNFHIHAIPSYSHNPHLIMVVYARASTFSLSRSIADTSALISVEPPSVVSLFG